MAVSVLTRITDDKGERRSTAANGVSRSIRPGSPMQEREEEQALDAGQHPARQQGEVTGRDDRQRHQGEDGDGHRPARFAADRFVGHRGSNS